MRHLLGAIFEINLLFNVHICKALDLLNKIKLIKVFI
jgi:hypothetical protein